MLYFIDFALDCELDLTWINCGHKKKEKKKVDVNLVPLKCECTWVCMKVCTSGGE